MPGEQPHQLFLRAVRVLKFVHHQVLEALAPRRAHIGVIAQKFHRAQQQIVEIHARRLAENLVVGAENVGRLLARVVVARLVRFRFHLVGRDAVILRVADLRAHAARRIIVRRKIELQQGALHRGGLVVIIVDGEIARQPDARSFAPKQPRAEGMKCGDPHVRRVAARSSAAVRRCGPSSRRRLCS